LPTVVPVSFSSVGRAERLCLFLLPLAISLLRQEQLLQHHPQVFTNELIAGAVTARVRRACTASSFSLVSEPPSACHVLSLLLAWYGHALHTELLHAMCYCSALLCCACGLLACALFADCACLLACCHYCLACLPWLTYCLLLALLGRCTKLRLCCSPNVRGYV
jgi:hypothetical protein